MNGRPWSDDEIAVLRTRFDDTVTHELARMLGRRISSVYNKAHALKLKKSPAHLKRLLAFEADRLRTVGAAFRFKPGHVPANKGLRRPGWAPGRMRETQFKKGQMASAAQRKWVPIGTEVLDDQGYLKRKITDERNKPSRFNWRYVHTLLWEQHYGPLLPGYAVKFIDGNKTNIVLSNLCLVSRQDLMRLNTVHNLPKELAHVIQLRGAVMRQINRRLRHEKQNARPA